MTRIWVGERTFDVGVARTPAQWARGLTDPTIVGPDGLLFAMPAGTTARFHMRRVNQPVLLVLFDDDGHLVDATLLDAETGTYHARRPFRYALELVGYRPEDTLELLKDLSGGLHHPLH